MYLAPGVPRDASRHGGLAVAVPGEVAGCAEAVARHGKLRLARVLAPAIALARKGFPVGPHLARTLARSPGRVRRSPGLARMFTAGGKVLRLGQPARRPRLARALAAIARKGPRVFYRGWIARDLVHSVARAGGKLTLEDLAGYRVRWRTPLEGGYRGHTLYTMPPPSSGGVALIEALNILRRFPLASAGHNSSLHLHWLAEAFKHAFADRARHLGDTDFVKVPVARLTSRAYADRLSRRIGRKVKPRDSYGSPAAARAPSGGSGGTSHLSVVDGDGNAVAMTSTINTSFGSPPARGSPTSSG
jgi:gamma-glutamyltranspeptidase/glutathione hydrolase